jgi:dynein heavy chain, axonemal
MLYMTGHINYGGRVTDDIDRILLISLLENCYGKAILNPNVHEELQKKSKVLNKTIKKGKTSAKSKPVAKEALKQSDKLLYQFDFSFFKSGRYSIPPKHQKLSDIHKYIEQLPDIDSPEIFGMHPNAEISCR